MSETTATTAATAGGNGNGARGEAILVLDGVHTYYGTSTRSRACQLRSIEAKS